MSCIAAAVKPTTCASPAAQRAAAGQRANPAACHLAFKSAAAGSTAQQWRAHATQHSAPRAAARRVCCVAASATTPLKALIWDCDGVIVESEEIHRLAYNAAFQHFDVRCPGQDGPVDWTVAFYDELQNTVGGGKPKMRWYFGQKGWPTSSILQGQAPASQEQQDLLIDTLQDWKTEKYKEIVGSGQVSARPGVVRLMDEARAAGVPVAVCSAATKSAVVFVLSSLLGKERFEGLDLFMAGDDVPVKKPDPTIYKVAAQRLGVDPADCLVIEDSTIGLAAAKGAGMRCAITYTHSTRGQEFEGAECMLESLENVQFGPLAAGELQGRDDRVAAAATVAA